MISMGATVQLLGENFQNRNRPTDSADQGKNGSPGAGSLTEAEFSTWVRNHMTRTSEGAESGHGDDC